MELDSIWCWLIPILVGLLCALLGYFWGKSTAKPKVDQSATDALQAKINRLEADLKACEERLIAPPSPQEDLSISPLAAVPTTMAFDADAAKAAFDKRIKQDDLKIVEGIGPKIEGLFHNAGIDTWKALSETAASTCQEVLDSGGDRYRIHDPASWPMQAKMAYEGRWKQLVKWQDEHKAGKF